MSTDAPELRMRRRLLRMLGTLRPIRAGYQMRPVTVGGIFGVAVAAVMAPFVTAPLGSVVPWLPFVAGPAVVVAAPAVLAVDRRCRCLVRHRRGASDAVGQRR
ncbi:hypothetical protein GCM10027614_16940 [Micromonospora vulcania]